MDFVSSNLEGGASSLVKTVKSFIGVGIKNKVITLFDNDSAAKNKLLNLRNIAIPENFRILQYPNIEFAKSYPTIGLNGNSKMDINDKACSIELYLGRDVLKLKRKFIPIGVPNKAEQSYIMEK